MEIYEEPFRFIYYNDGYLKDNFDGTFTVYRVSERTGFDLPPYVVDKEPTDFKGKPRISEGVTDLRNFV
jgi:hypothetical protein